MHSMYTIQKNDFKTLYMTQGLFSGRCQIWTSKSDKQKTKHRITIIYLLIMAVLEYFEPVYMYVTMNSIRVSYKDCTEHYNFI
jgi:hypothetical protein